jgi:predicted ATP-grasp superfamily ATP-dependent carboligase
MIDVCLYEWCCSGGLHGQSANAGLEGIAVLGQMMLEALAADAARDPELAITVLVDAGRAVDVPPGVRVRPVEPGMEMESLVAAAQEAAWTVIVAPENEGILAARVAGVRSAGARVLAAPGPFIAVSSDKQATVDALAAAGVPVPAGRSLSPAEPVPAGFHLPAVRKVRDGVGCEGMEIVHRRDAPPAAAATRLEALVAGTPVGVSCLCGPRGIEVLPPMQQRFSEGDRPQYLGSEFFVDESMARRAGALARRSVAAVASAAGGEQPIGWVGVDMILGSREDGRLDRVLEVNPRLTVSFVWHAPRAPSSLVRSLIDRARQ